MKIALLGTENSHAWEFSKIIADNPEKYKDVEIVGLYGEDEAANIKIVDAGYASYIAKSSDEFLGKVDAVMVTSRHGDNHYKIALPYIKAGIPCFIDKPFTVDLKKGEELIMLAKENNVPLCGGSTLKFMEGLKEQREIIEKFGALGGEIAAPINMVNDYGNFFFYSQHLVEIMLTVYGNDIKSVMAYCPDESKNRLTFIANYGDFDVTGHYIDRPHYVSTLYYNEDVIHSECVCGRSDINTLFPFELDEFLKMVKTGKMTCSYERLLLPVKVINAIYNSYTSKKVIEIK